MELQYLTYDKIDKRKWDDCINASINKLIYAESVFLDNMSAHWDAIVMNDYEAVMPLTWKRKYGIKYLYQPPFFQQGGVFSKKKLTAEIINAFIDKASEHFRFAEITLNYLNRNLSPSYKPQLRNNYIFSIGNRYEKTFQEYDTYIRQRLKRLEKFKMIYKISKDYQEAIRVYKKTYQQKLSNIKAADFKNFEVLCSIYAKQDRVVVRKVYDSDEKTLLACVLILKDENRLYNLASTIFPEGKKKLANYFLFDSLIREFSGQKMILDFEGSDIPGVAFFYKKFATENQQYPFIKWNKLPVPLKLLKR